jgi:Flp pilus assembly protein TadD
MDKRRLMPIILLAAGLVAYHNSFRCPFIFDDVHSIVENPYVSKLWLPGYAMLMPQPTALGCRPLAALSIGLNYQLGGLNVMGYHAFNFVVHMLVGLTLFGIVRRTLRMPGLRDHYGPHADGLALAVAVIWLVHPLLTECVTYIIQRTESMMALFLLLTVYCVIRAADTPKPGDWFVAAIVSCALGMGSKEVMAVAPLLVLLYDRVFLAGSFAEAFRRRGDLYLGLAATWLVLWWLVGSVDVATRTRLIVRPMSSWEYARTQCGVVAHYLRLCFWPHPLVLDYDSWPVAASLREVLPQAVLLLVLLAATVWAWRHKPGFGYLGVWFFVALGPTSSFLPLPTELAAERRMYVPSMAVITFMVLGGYWLAKATLRRLAVREQAQAAVAFGLALGITTTLGVLTIRRNYDYRSAVVMWRDVVAKRPNNARARMGLGVALLQQGDVTNGLLECAEAVRTNPDLAEARNDLALALAANGKLDEAIAQYREALRLRPNYAELHNNLGGALLTKGLTNEAVAQFYEALRLKPELAGARQNLESALGVSNTTGRGVGTQ